MDEIKTVFYKNNGFDSASHLKEAGIPYSVVKKNLKEGKIIRLRRGFYQWHEIDETNEVSVVVGLFPDGILCMDNALFYYGYSDRTPTEWHIAVNKDTSKVRFNIQYPFIKPYYYEPHTLSIGIAKGTINGIEISVYDRERTICDYLRNASNIDREIFNKAVQGYIADPKKSIANLIDYSKRLRVFKRVQDLIGVWL